jgi:hypothetical protein
MATAPDRMVATCGSNSEVAGLERDVPSTLNSGPMRCNEDKRPDSGFLRSCEQNWTCMICEQGHTWIMASKRKVLTREATEGLAGKRVVSCTSRAR